MSYTSLLKKNVLENILGSYKNNVLCDLYIGSGAGKKFLQELNNAQKSIKIVSPYLSPSFVQELIKLHKKDIHIQLITEDKIEDFYGDYERVADKLIIQKRQTSATNFKKKSKLEKHSKILSIFAIVLLLLTAGIYYYLQEKLTLLTIPVTILMFLMSWLLKSKAKKTVVYTYKYHQLFPFKVYQSSKDNFIHSKIYIIDDTIAYLGSLNFTYAASKTNHETRIRTEDSDALEAILEAFSQLMNNTTKNKRFAKNIQDWGKELYSEPIN
jgi:phosphatidylserine/phosphatidylglycerophosphate/cardiolipin synthase-like enzyme